MRDGNKIKKNLVIGVLGQLCTVFLGIIVPKLILTSYGSEVNGLLASITNIYSYIALVETGMAASVCQALYKPIANKDREEMNAVMAAANKYYHKTGVVYLLLVGLFSAIYPMLIQTEIPWHTVVSVILLNGLGNVVNYFFHGKYLILLKADGRNYVRTGVDMLTNTIKQISKIILISMGYDVVFVQLIAMCASFVQMAYITYYINKNYAWIDLKANPNEQAISQRSNVVIHEINYLITSNVDVVLLTVFTNLKTVSVYSLYSLLFGMIGRVLITIRDSLEFKIAHAFHSDKEAFKRLFRAFELYYTAFAFSLYSVMYLFVIPFISLYTTGVTDVNYIDERLVLLFVFINLLNTGKYPLNAMVHISGHFKQTQNSAVIEAAINLLSSVVLVRIYGIVGALLGTVLSLLYRMMYLSCYVNANVIQRSWKETYRCWGVNLIVFAAVVLLSRFVTIRADTYFQLAVTCVPYTLGMFVLYFGAAIACEPQTFHYILGLGNRK